ncbi:MAG: TetR/AcrR family transcriptional regulator [Solirubrobacteraceae bacterium]
MAVAEPKTVRGRETRERILRAAAEVVAEQGAAAMSLDSVGVRARASRSQLYHYFDDRADLVRAVVRATAEAVLGAQAEHLEHLDSWAAIEAWFDQLVSFQEVGEARGGCPIGSLVGQLAERDDTARAALAASLDRWEGHLADGLARMHARGELAPRVDPSRLATATMASLQGGLLLTQARRDPVQLRTALDGAMSMLRTAAARPHRKAGLDMGPAARGRDTPAR